MDAQLSNTDYELSILDGKVIRMGKYGDNLATVIAQQLRAERAAAGLTHKQLAEKANLTEQSVIRYLTEKREIKSSDLGALCDALGLTPQELLARAVNRIK